jgi:hypothetical protein
VSVHTTSFWWYLAFGAAMAAAAAAGAAAAGAAALLSSAAAKPAFDAAVLGAFAAMCAAAAIGGVWICWFLVAGRARLTRAAREIAAAHADPAVRAKAVHDWVFSHITYDHAEYGLIRKSDSTPGHQVAEAAAYFGTGVCSAMAEAVVRIALAAGLRAERVSVRVDRDGREVLHGCARFTFPDGTWADSDPAFQEWDVRHKAVTDLGGRPLPTKEPKTQAG